MSIRTCRPLLRLLASASLLATAACASAPEREAAFPEEASAAASPEASTETSPPPSPALPPGTIARTDLDHVLTGSPAWLLQQVELQEVLNKGSKFVGWRLASMPKTWDGFGVQPGDVVTKVNGASVERPDEFWTVWVGLADAKEIRIDLERDGKPQVATILVAGAPTDATKAALSTSQTPPPREGDATLKPGQRDTIVIGGGTDPTEPTFD
jgi:hypothetical protein